MSAIGIRRSTFDGLSAVRRAVVRLVCDRLDLGTPALYQTAAAQQWYIFDDHRISLRDVAILGKMAANLGALNITTAGKTRAEIRAELVAWVQSLNVVWPEAINYTGQANPWQHTLDANGAPVSVRADSSVPSGLTPVETP